jgi:lysozyme family protein
MDRNFNRAVEAVLKHEGGFVDHPKDPGGATNKGITIANFRRYVKPNGTVADLKKLTTDQAKTVYRRMYWDAVHGSELPDGVDFAVFDFAVNSGPTRAAQYLQRIVGASQDGRIGPATLKAVRAIPHAKLINDYQDARLAFLKGLKIWGTFGKGWSRRVSEVRSLALSMAANPSTAYTPKPSVPELLAEEAKQPVKVEPVKVHWLTALIAAIARLIGKQ